MQESPEPSELTRSCLSFWVPRAALMDHLGLNELGIADLSSDDLPVHEPGLVQVVKQCRGKSLFCSTDVKGTIQLNICFSEHTWRDQGCEY